MFSSDTLKALASDHRHFLRRLREIAATLDARFADSRGTIDALMLAVASGEPLLLVGPPGTGKSRLIRAFCELAGVTNRDGTHDEENYFEYLLTPFTEPGELFGFYDIKRAQEGKGLHRIEAHTLQKARVVYLDEFFNGSSAILNSLLAIMNERRFHDRGEVKKVNMECLFGATNSLPQTPELKAVFDRFLLRVHVDNVPADRSDAMRRLLERGWADTYHAPLVADRGPNLFEEAKGFRAALHRIELKVDAAPAFFKALTCAVGIAREFNLSEMSNRRLVKMVRLMAIHALYEAADVERSPKPHLPVLALARPQLLLIPQLFLDREDDEVMSKLENCCRSAALP